MSRSSAVQAAAGLQPAAGSADRVALVQPHGVVLVVHEAGARIVQASAHAGAWLGQPLDTLLLGPVDQLGGDFAARLREWAAREEAADWAAPLALACTVGPPGRTRSVEAWVHRAGPDLLTLDLLPLSAPETVPVHEAPSDARRGAGGLLEQLEDAIHALGQAHTIGELAQEAVRRVQALCGHEEVRLLRFDHEGSGGIVAASRDDGATLCASLAWPAQLHTQPQGWAQSAPGGVDVLVDAWDDPVSLLPQHLPGSVHVDAAEQVVSVSTLRSPSPARLAGLRAAGIRAEARAALQREGKPWGLIVCLDGQCARPLPAARRYALGLIVEAVATRITAIESAGRAEVAEQV
ncbi:MAG: GAF domain-containing protein, partial [Rubrivivax sp.]